MRDIESLILDMDGVLWHGETPHPGIVDLFTTLDGLTLPYVLATNNAMKVAQQYTEKLARFGIAVPPERILTSSEVTASYLRRSHPDIETVYVVGEEGLHQAICAQGFEVVGPERVRSGERVPAVVAGLTREALSYELLAMASRLLHGGPGSSLRTETPPCRQRPGRSPGQVPSSHSWRQRRAKRRP